MRLSSVPINSQIWSSPKILSIFSSISLVIFFDSATAVTISSIYSGLDTLELEY